MIRKVYVVLAVIFLSRLIISCCHCGDCENEILEFNYGTVEISNLDNSAKYTTSLEGKTMKRAAVAFRVKVASEEIPYSFLFNSIAGGFSSASACQCDCYPFYKSNQDVESIHIRTIYDISETVIGNSVVDDLFRAKERWGGAEVDDFKTIEEFVVELPKRNKQNEETLNFQLFCTEEIDNDFAQFEIEIVFTDGLILTATTDLIQLQ